MSKRRLIVYNANYPTKLFTCIRVDETDSSSPTLSQDQYAIIEEVCEGGPYFAFFRDVPDMFYMLRHSYDPDDAEKPVWYELRIANIRNDERQQSITSELLRKSRQKTKK
jgi:hypothetical protein